MKLCFITAATIFGRGPFQIFDAALDVFPTNEWIFSRSFSFQIRYILNRVEIFCRVGNNIRNVIIFLILHIALTSILTIDHSYDSTYCLPHFIRLKIKYWKNSIYKNWSAKITNNFTLILQSTIDLEIGVSEQGQ